MKTLRTSALTLLVVACLAFPASSRAAWVISGYSVTGTTDFTSGGSGGYVAGNTSCDCTASAYNSTDHAHVTANYTTNLSWTGGGTPPGPAHVSLAASATGGLPNGVLTAYAASSIDFQGPTDGSLNGDTTTNGNPYSKSYNSGTVNAYAQQFAQQLEAHAKGSPSAKLPTLRNRYRFCHDEYASSESRGTYTLH